MVSVVNKVTRKAVNAIRVRTAGLLTVIIAYLLPVLLMTWCFQVHDELLVRIWLTLLVAVLPVLVLLSPPKSWTWQGAPFWFGILFWIAVLLSAGRQFDLAILSVNAAVALLTLPLWWLIWRLTGRSWLLLAGLLLGLAATMIYWLAALGRVEDWQVHLLLPLPLVVFVGVAWAPFAGVAFYCAKRWKSHRIGGPGWQAVAMGLLFFPPVFVAIYMPTVLELGQNWFAVSLAISGVLLGAVVADPLRQFLLELGNLSPDPKPYQEEPQDFSGRKE